MALKAENKIMTGPNVSYIRGGALVAIQPPKALTGVDSVPFTEKLCVANIRLPLRGEREQLNCHPKEK